MKLSETSSLPGPPETSEIYLPSTRITISYYVAFVALGLTAASLGPTLLGLANHTHTQPGQISFLFPARALGYMLGSLVGGQLYDRRPGNPLMGMMLIVLALGLALTPIISWLWLLAIILLGIGLVEGGIDVGGNTLLVWLHRNRVGPFMNALHFFFALGATLSPIIIAQALGLTGDITWGYWALAILVFPVSTWLFNLPSPIPQRAGEARPARPADRLLVFLLAVFFFFFVAAEVSYGGWIALYAFTSDLATQTTAAYMTAAFWGALMLGRLCSIPLARHFGPRTILLSDLLGCLFGVSLLLIWPGSLAAAWLGTCGIGFAMASLFPTAISLAEQSMPITGRITSWFLVGASLGGMSLPWLIGQLFAALGPQVVMWAIWLDLAAALALFLVLRGQLGRGNYER